MYWQYRTILFEFQKDGLLGDKYVDDEEVEKVLNEQGGQGWELVSVSTVQEGLLTFFKRVRQMPRIQQPAEQQGQPRVEAMPKAPAVAPPPVKGGEQDGQQKPGEKTPLGPKKTGSRIGEIKIS